MGARNGLGVAAEEEHSRLRGATKGEVSSFGGRPKPLAWAPRVSSIASELEPRSKRNSKRKFLVSSERILKSYTFQSLHLVLMYFVSIRFSRISPCAFHDLHVSRQQTRNRRLPGGRLVGGSELLASTAGGGKEPELCQWLCLSAFDRIPATCRFCVVGATAEDRVVQGAFLWA